MKVIFGLFMNEREVEQMSIEVPVHDIEFTGRIIADHYITFKKQFDGCGFDTVLQLPGPQPALQAIIDNHIDPALSGSGCPAIYTVTVVSGDPNQADVKTRMRVCHWGYYFEREAADCAIQNNLTDMSECGYYQYGVVSELGEGVCVIGDELQWYEFVWDDSDSDRQFLEAQKINKPAIYENIAFAGL